VLAVFSGDSVQADTAQARASLIEAQANAADAADNAARARTLASSGALSDQQINQYNTAEQTAKARVEAAKAVLDAQQLRGKNTQVLAPDSGVISARTATVGSVVPAGHRAVSPDTRRPAGVARRSHLGRTGPHQGRHGGHRGRRQRRRAQGPGAHDRAQRGPANPRRAGLRGPAGVGRHGFAGQGRHVRARRVRAGRHAGADRAAAGAGGARRLQLRVPPQPDNRITQLKVQTGRLAGDRIEITSGLAADAPVIVSGAGFLNDGDLVG
jgi:HlyD family secretion protein